MLMDIQRLIDESRAQIEESRKLVEDSRALVSRSREHAGYRYAEVQRSRAVIAESRCLLDAIPVADPTRFPGLHVGHT